MEPEVKTYKGRLIDIIELADARAAIEGFEFIDCAIRGPAVLLMDGVQIINTNLGADSDAVFWEIPPTRRRVVGAIYVKDCKFDQCVFVNIGIAGPEQLVRQIKGAEPGSEIPVIGGARMMSSTHEVVPPEDSPS